MSEIRDDLEKAAAELDAAVDENNLNSEQPETGASEPEEDEWLSAPTSYKKEYAQKFGELPKEWRQYLHVRETEAQKGLSELGQKVSGYKWVDDLFNPQAEALKAQGFNSSKEWFATLAAIANGLDTKPQKTLEYLIQAYSDNNEANNPYDARIGKVEQDLADLQKIAAQQQEANLMKMIDSFAMAKNSDGTLLHPFMADVEKEMTALINSGLAKDLTEAYDQAVWLNADVRQKMSQDSALANLSGKIAAANKAKIAAFGVKGKVVPSDKEKSLRETLEEKFANIDDE